MNLALQRFFTETQTTDLAAHHPALRDALLRFFTERVHGNAAKWDAVLEQIPDVNDTTVDFDQAAIQINLPGNVDLDQLQAQLLKLKPWRKGPFQIGDIFVDTEWRSDWKWQRLQDHIDLEDKTVLDVGTGNGYFLYRILGAGAKLAVGVDPTRLFLYQFEALQKLMPDNAAHLLPLRGEHLPAFNCFDTVLSMGVLYHRKEPMQHLRELITFLRPGGELILETLVIPADDDSVLIPEDRYAQMRNVWYIPSTSALLNLAETAGLTHSRIVDVTLTTTEEQRVTRWMDFQSLADFLDADNPMLTVEGYPAPRRAILIARAPDA